MRTVKLGREFLPFTGLALICKIDLILEMKQSERKEESDTENWMEKKE